MRSSGTIAMLAMLGSGGDEPTARHGARPGPACLEAVGLSPADNDDAAMAVYSAVKQALQWRSTAAQQVFCRCKPACHGCLSTCQAARLNPLRESPF